MTTFKLIRVSTVNDSNLVERFCVFSSENISHLKKNLFYLFDGLYNSHTMGCPPVRGNNPQALASGLSHVHVGNHGITILYHL